MNIFSYNVRIRHTTLGTILDENFVNPVQFKLFLKLINGCFISNEDLTFFNGQDFFINVPNKIMKECVITTNLKTDGITEQIIANSKIEELV